MTLCCNVLAYISVVCAALVTGSPRSAQTTVQLPLSGALTLTKYRGGTDTKAFGTLSTGGVSSAFQISHEIGELTAGAPVKYLVAEIPPRPILTGYKRDTRITGAGLQLTIRYALTRTTSFDPGRFGIPHEFDYRFLGSSSARTSCPAAHGEGFVSLSSPSGIQIFGDDTIRDVTVCQYYPNLMRDWMKFVFSIASGSFDDPESYLSITFTFEGSVTFVLEGIAVPTELDYDQSF